MTRFSLLTLSLTLIVSTSNAADAFVRTDVRDIGSFIGPSRLIELRGEIISAIGNQFALSDETGIVWIKAQDPVTWNVGCIVRVQAHAEKWEDPNNIWVGASLVEVIERHSGKTQPVPADIRKISTGDYNYKFISVEGTITDTFKDELDPVYTFLTIESERVSAVLGVRDPKVDLETLRSNIDRPVRVSGVCVPNKTGYRRYLSHIIYIDPGTAIERLPDTIGNCATFPRRIPYSGTVIAHYDATTFYLAADNCQRLKVHLLHGQSMPSVGNLVTVLGFFRNNVFFGSLFNSTVIAKRSDVTFDDHPTDIMPRQLLFDSGEEKLQVKYEGHAIRIEGSVRSISDDGSYRRRLILDCEGISVPVLTENIASPKIGSYIQASGICSINAESTGDPSGFVHLTGFSLLTRHTGDIVILKAPPWWTPAKFLSVILILLALVVLILIWNRSLHTLADRRGCELMDEQLGRVKADLRVNERTRLAVELHDAISQNLTGVSLQLDAVKRFADENPGKMMHHLDMAIRTLKSCRDELRNCLWDLRNRALEEKDLNEAIRRTVSPFIGNARLFLRFNIPREQISDNTTHALMRIVRELATNAVRHGHAQIIRIAGALEDDNLFFSVSDDGSGFDQQHHLSVDDGHFGLDGIRERIRAFGGEMIIDTAPGKGCTIKIRLNT